MVEITFVRHGQANTGATDEASYDKLSALGHQQARWLGEHFAHVGAQFDHVFAGSLHRQVDTAKEICGVIGGDVQCDERLNEIDYFALADNMRDVHGLAVPRNGEEFAPHVPVTFKAWMAGEVHAAPETYAQFVTRIDAMLGDMEALAQKGGKTGGKTGGKILLVSSGGVISKVKRQVLGLDVQQWAQALLSTRNSSVHRYHHFLGALQLDVFNAIPHLDHPDRVHARTYT